MKKLSPEEKEEQKRRERACELGQELSDAVTYRDYDRAKKILHQAVECYYPGTVANWLDENEFHWRDYNPLAAACCTRNVEMVKLLLSFPAVIPQDKDCKVDPVHKACGILYDVEALKLLLRDSRIRADISDNRGYSPLRGSREDPEVIRWLIASRKPLTGRVRDVRDALSDVKQQAERFKHLTEISEAVELLQAYYDDPAATTKRIRAELGVDVSDAAELYALMVLFCDGYLALPPVTAPETPARRFFGMVSRLPLELQMMTCHRAFDSARDLVRRQDSEAAFKRLGEILALEDGWKGCICRRVPPYQYVPPSHSTSSDDDVPRRKKKTPSPPSPPRSYEDDYLSIFE